MYPDVRQVAGNNHQAAFSHFMNVGIYEKRRASAQFDVNFYLQLYPDLKAVYGNDPLGALNHWRTTGLDEGRQGSREVSSSYILKNWNVQALNVTTPRQALGAYKVGDSASDQFSCTAYLSNYADLFRNFSYEQLAKSYLRPNNSAVPALVGDCYLSLLHWVSTGIYEGRVARYK